MEVSPLSQHMRIGPLNISWSNESRDTYAYQQDLGKFISCLTGGYSEENLIKLFGSIPEVFAPIDTIAGAVCAAEWQLRRVKDDEVVYDNKDWNNLLARPNWKQDWKKFIYDAIVYKYVTGNRYIYAYVPDTLTIKLANVVNLWLLPSQYTMPKIKSDRPNFLQALSSEDIVEYYDFISGKDKLRIQPKNLSHDTFLDINTDLSYDVVRGKSPLVACEYPMSNIIAVYQARNIIVVRQGPMGLIVSKKSDASGLQALTKSEKAQLLEDTIGGYGITGKKSPIGVTSMPVDFIKTGLSIAELEPYKETEASANAIYGVLRVPEELKPGSTSTYENQRIARRGLFTNVAMPEAFQLAAIIANLLKLSESGYYIFPSFENVADMQENKKEKSDVDWRNNETLRVRFSNGVITLNDWIVEAGYKAATGVPLYDKRLLEMTPEEQALVLAIIKAHGAGGNNNNQNSNDTSTPQ